MGFTVEVGKLEPRRWAATPRLELQRLRRRGQQRGEQDDRESHQAAKLTAKKSPAAAGLAFWCRRYLLLGVFLRLRGRVLARVLRVGLGLLRLGRLGLLLGLGFFLGLLLRLRLSGVGLAVRLRGLRKGAQRERGRNQRNKQLLQHWEISWMC